MRLNLFLFLFLLNVSAQVFARDIDINLNDETAEFSVMLDHSSDVSFGSTEFDASFFYNTDDDVMFEAGFQVVDHAGSKSPGLKVSVGSKVFTAKVKKEDFVAVTLGGEARYKPPVAPRLGLVGRLFVSPDIVTFGDAEKFVYFNARIQYDLLPQAIVYLGRRNVTASIPKKSDLDIDSTTQVGIKFLF